MITFKATIRKRRADGFHAVYIRGTHKRKVFYIPTDKVVNDKGLSGNDVTDPFVLKFCATRICEYQERLNRVNTENWTPREIVDFLTQPDDDICFSDYARKHIDRMIDRGQVRNAKNYKLALQHMERFFGTDQVMFSQLTTVNMQRWIQSLETTARSKEMYPVCMRQVFKAAVEELNDYDNEIIRIKTNPWVKTKIPHADTPEKRAISAEECRAFFSCALPVSKFASPLPEFGRDVAMLVLCLAGINTIDLFELKKSDYYGGIIHYRRAKTRNSRTDGAYIEMRVPEVLNSLLEKYSSDDEYLFNFHSRHSSSDSFNANANIGIKKVCESLGIPKGKQYCVYTFRHTWATTAQNDCGANLAEVGFAMNHSQRSVTRGYVKIDFTPAWELNEKVVDFIFFSDKQSKMAHSVENTQPKNDMFRISPKMLLRACAFFQGKLLAHFDDLGFSNVDEVIARLNAMLPATVPERSIVQFKIVNLDNDKVAVYEHMVGKGI